ncbi:MAG: pyridoxal-phosphate dependent enzyme [Pirellulales bacterium]
MSIWRWSNWLLDGDQGVDAVPEEARVSLGEGNTPLVKSRSLGPSVGLNNLWFKLESVSPTGSYKDRFAAAAISHMRARGERLCVATSSGNTGAALAAYAAAGGVRCRIAIVETAPVDKLRQMLAYGAELIRVRGFGLDPDITAQTLGELLRRSEEPDARLQISAFRYSPEGMAGVQTITWEIAEQLADPPDHIFCCAGGGGLTLAIARGAARLCSEGHWRECPAIECVQPTGNATIAAPLRDGGERAVTVKCTTTVSGLQVPTVIDGDETLAACRDTGGTGLLVDDAWVFEVQTRLAREEGIFCEPAAAVPLAGALLALREGRITADSRVVCLVTGSGFKDAASVERMVAGRECPLVDVARLPELLDAP